MKIGRNDPCSCGSGGKYKKCCLDKNEKEKILQEKARYVSRGDLISGPYKQCPNLECSALRSFGVFVMTGGSRGYARECVKCGHKQWLALPRIKKKVIYLDQFVISNLIKLLDKSHPSHKKIKADPFWSALFVKLEGASKAQAIVCPDSFLHVDESLAGSIDFRLMKRLYEHFSNGKTLYPSIMIEKNQMVLHFEGWLEKKKTEFEFDPQSISFGRDLHDWSVGLRVSVGGNPYPGQLESLQKTNAATKEQLKEVWARWQNEKIRFLERVREETSGVGRGLINAAKKFAERRAAAMVKIASGEDYNVMDQEDFLPPMSSDILEALARIAKKKSVPAEKILETVGRYFTDVDSLLEIPQIRIVSVIFAGLAHLAANGKKNPPKSTADIQFISSYLPYCDALFVDKESALLLKEFPQNTPAHLRLNEFPAKVFSLANKNEFLDYLDQLIVEIPEDQISILKDLNGEDYMKPYWNIIENEKRDW